ncbi:MAG: DNA polymerase III subunit epsilon, partial [Xanthomonadales bacterium]|nr:DNA polymerase III subunit epsilon [Xanthomonadales bacterium]
RYEVDNSTRSLHGALLDAEILADVYLAMTGGQEDLGLSIRQSGDAEGTLTSLDAEAAASILVIRASDEELEAHRARLADIHQQSRDCMWLEMEDDLPV